MCRQSVTAARHSSWLSAQQCCLDGRQQRWSWCSCCWRQGLMPCKGEAPSAAMGCLGAAIACACVLSMLLWQRKACRAVCLQGPHQLRTFRLYHGELTATLVGLNVSMAAAGPAYATDRRVGQVDACCMLTHVCLLPSGMTAADWPCTGQLSSDWLR